MPGAKWRVMPNLANVLKAEITRLARKELRVAVEGLRKTAAAQRSEIASIKKKVTELEKQLKAASRRTASSSRGSALLQPTEAPEADNSALRFRAAGMAANRKRLGLSAADFGLLIGASGQSVYLWERGTAKPGKRNLAAIASLRGIGKKEATHRLVALKAQP